MPLFRKEVLDGQRERLHGEVNLSTPISWQLIGYTLLGGLFTAFLFLLFASYSRVETVAGAIVLDRGVAAIVPSRPGIITALSVSEGEPIRAGAPLALIRAEEDMQTGGTAPERMLEALKAQDSSLSSQSSAILQAAVAERARLAAETRGLFQELASLDQQIASQRRLVELAESDFEDLRQVAARGFISRRDLEERESLLLSRRQQLSQLEQAHSSLSADLVEARRSAAQASANAHAQSAGVASSRAEVAQQLADVESTRGYVLRSPIAGTVTAVTARVGQPVDGREALMRVVPGDAVPRAELYVPTSAIGFLAAGQNVRLAVDAFPYQRFGTVEGTIMRVSSVAVGRADESGKARPVYLVTVALPRPWVVAFGRPQRLLPGMTLSARIVTRKQRLLEWLFEPVLAVSQR